MQINSLISLFINKKTALKISLAIKSIKVLFRYKKYKHLWLVVNIEGAISILRGKKSLLSVAIIIYFLRHYYLKAMIGFDMVALITVICILFLVLKEYLDRQFRILLLKLVK